MYKTSFRQVDGRVRNLSEHMLRLGGVLTPSDQMNIRQRLQAIGSSSCVVVIRAERSFWEVDIRPDIDTSAPLRVSGHAIKDERRSPLHHSANSIWIKRQLDAVQRVSADEGLLTDRTGRVLQGLFSSIIVITGATAHISTHPDTLPSVLENPVLKFLGSMGVTVHPHPKGLPRYVLRRGEVWFVDSYAGIRPVDRWVEYGAASPAYHHSSPHISAEKANEWLWETAEHV